MANLQFCTVGTPLFRGDAGSLGSIPTWPTRKRSPSLYRSCSYHVLSRNSQFLDANTFESTSIAQEHRRSCELYDLHNVLIPYGEAWSWQKSIVKDRKALVDINQDFSDTLIVLQHPNVYTLGTGSSENYLNFYLEDAPYDIYGTERGGEVTYHGPGQGIRN